MSHQTHTCVSFACDGTLPSGKPCGNTWWDEQDDPGTPHWPDLATALAHLTDNYSWVLTDHGDYCPDCAARHLPKATRADVDRMWQPYPDLFEGA